MDLILYFLQPHLPVVAVVVRTKIQIQGQMEALAVEAAVQLLVLPLVVLVIRHLLHHLKVITVVQD
jgi:hypothetical protein